MKNTTFEDFLKETHIELNPQILDDDLPDSFEDWLANLPVEMWLALGEKHSREQFSLGAQRGIKNFAQANEAIMSAIQNEIKKTK